MHVVEAASVVAVNCIVNCASPLLLFSQLLPPSTHLQPLHPPLPLPQAIIENIGQEKAVVDEAVESSREDEEAAAKLQASSAGRGGRGGRGKGRHTFCCCIMLGIHWWPQPSQ